MQTLWAVLGNCRYAFYQSSFSFSIKCLMWEGKKIRSGAYFGANRKCSDMHPFNNKPCGNMSITIWICLTKFRGPISKRKTTDLQMNIVYVHNHFSLAFSLCLNHNASSLPVNPTSVVVKKACCVFALHLSCENVNITNEVQSWRLYGCISAGGGNSLCSRICSKLHYFKRSFIFIIIILNSINSSQSSFYMLCLSK